MKFLPLEIGVFGVCGWIGYVCGGKKKKKKKVFTVDNCVVVQGRRMRMKLCVCVILYLSSNDNVPCV
ncbi:hypothetical protein Hanom_Chr06g00543421 [Helianthus anomalus]